MCALETENNCHICTTMYGKPIEQALSALLLGPNVNPLGHACDENQTYSLVLTLLY